MLAQAGTSGPTREQDGADRLVLLVRNEVFVGLDVVKPFHAVAPDRSDKHTSSRGCNTSQPAY